MANYIREPYSADLDFGTGEWSTSAWVNMPESTTTSQYETYGVDLLNGAGAFTDSTGWTGLSAECTISGGVLTKTGSSTHYITSPAFSEAIAVGDVLLVTATVTSNPYLAIGINLHTIANWNTAPTLASTGTLYRVFVASTTAPRVLLSFSGAVTGTLTNLVVKRVKPSSICHRSFSSGTRVELSSLGPYNLKAVAYDGTTTREVIYPSIANVSNNPQLARAIWTKAEACYTTDGTLSIRVNGVEVAATRGNPLLTLNNSNAVLTIGNSYALDAPFPGSIALLKLSATVPTPEQSVWMYEQEKQMFREGAQVTLPDSNAIADLAYDEVTDKWIAVSSANMSEWSGLVRTNVTAVPSGSFSKLASAGGVTLQGRITTNPGVDITIPAYGLREELVKRAESAARMNAQLATFDYVGGFTASTTTGSTSITSVAGLSYPVSAVGAQVTGAGIPAGTAITAVSGATAYLSKAATATGTAVQISFVDFILPVGMEAKSVLSAGAVKQEGSTKDYVRLFDGFKETIRFSVAPGYTSWVQIQVVRSST